MNFELSDEQQLTKDSVERLMADEYGFESRRNYQKEKRGYSEAMWSRYAEMGLLALPFAEEHGGVGGGAVEMMVVMEAFGKGLILEPYFATVVLAGSVLRHAANEAQKAELISAIAEGRQTWAFAYAEPQSRYDLFDVETTAKKEGGGWILNGTKSLVLHGDTVDRVIVSARTSGHRREKDGIGLFVVDASARGVSRRGYPTQDGSRAAEVTLDNVRATDVIGDPTGAYEIISRVADEAIAALCAEAVGCFDQMQSITLDYLKTREQFGKKIGTFQALQHRAADVFVELEQSRSMAMYAAIMTGESDPEQRERAMSAAKVQIGRSARLIGQESVQFHGGIGMTMEYSIGHYFKRVTMIDRMLGDAAHHLKRLAALEGTDSEQQTWGLIDA
ncbi:acyl-CoA dehydrogenase family protein [Bradyrhizobium sp. LMG 9283]|uniref:acyl-CoA dehydrogenase family protein n=1 Tax=Bradyrhizobium sp. LMG 9283 TaxID=592064 RepID=UPI0038906DA6